MGDHAIEVVTWDPVDHNEIPGLAHGLTRYGAHWIDIGLSVIPVDVDPLAAFDSVCARLREVLADQVRDIEYFTVDVRAASAGLITRPDQLRTKDTSRSAI